MRSYLKAGVGVGLGLSLALVLGATLLSFRSLGEQGEAADSVTHTHLVIEGLETLRAEVLRAENARRGYALTGDPSFVPRFAAARDGLQKNLGAVRTLTADNALQQKRLDELEPLIQQRMELLEQSMSRPYSGPRDAFQARLTLPGAELTAQINVLVRTMQDTEQELLRARDAEAKRSARRTRLLLALGAAATIAAMLAVFLLLRREIRQRARAEEHLRDLAASLEGRAAERTAALEEQTRTLADQASLLELAHDSIFVRDMNSAVRFWNHGAQETYGWTKEEAQGKVTHTLLQTEFPEPLAKIEEQLFARGHWEGELVHTRRDGSRIVVASRWALLREADNTPGKVLEINREITERKRAEEEIRKLNMELEQRVKERTAELQASNGELEAFTSSVAHDLRAPLRHVDGFGRILIEEHASQLDPEGRRLLERVLHATQHMGELVDDLLNLSRVSRREISPVVTDLNTVVRELIADLQPACQGRRVEFRAGTLPYAQCDPGLVRQVFANLLSNAVKFTRPRDPAIIEVGQTDRDGARVIFVRDNGVGFSMRYAGKLFGVFQRLHRSEDFEGTGVGLATVERIIQKHHGRIWAEAEVDKGATFFFSLEGLEERRAADSPRVAGGIHAAD